MKLANDFKNFLNDTVNLNQTRIDRLDERVTVIKDFIRNSDWEPRVSTFIEQGSWAHDTIIRPVDGGEFDADLLVQVHSVDGWSAAQYVKALGRIFLESGRYKDKTVVYDYCVTITYADDCKIDIAPLVVGREYQGVLEVCNKRSNEFEESRPSEYTDWMRQKNGYSGGNSFRKATRLVKYIRDIKRRFSCQSVLLTTLIGLRIEWWDKDSSEFADTPSALQTLMARLDDWLQDNPERPDILNPVLASQNFADLWNDIQYANFRNFINKYRKWIDEAIAASTRADSIDKWRRVFGDEFAKDEEANKAEASIKSHTLSLLRDGAAHLDGLVDRVIDFGIGVLPISFRRPRHIHAPQWTQVENLSRNVTVYAKHYMSKGGRGYTVGSGEALRAKGGLLFDIRVNGFHDLPSGFYVRWRITNTGSVAMAKGHGRGWFESPTDGNKRWEDLSYRGVHMAEAFIIRNSDNFLVGYSEPFFVVVT